MFFGRDKFYSSPIESSERSLKMSFQEFYKLPHVQTLDQSKLPSEHSRAHCSSKFIHLLFPPHSFIPERVSLSFKKEKNKKRTGGSFNDLNYPFLMSVPFSGGKQKLKVFWIASSCYHLWPFKDREATGLLGGSLV